MKVVFMGTPDFAVPPLKRMKEEGYDIQLVVSQPDRPKNRGKKVLSPPVIDYAKEHGIPTFQPDGEADVRELVNRLKEMEPEIIIVAAYGKILSKEILSLPRLGCVNIHASLLPKHRGAAPIQHAILAGDEKTGATLMYMSEGLDEGDMIAHRSTIICDKTAGELHDEIAVLGADLLIDMLPDIRVGKAKRTSQDDDSATYASKIAKEDALIDFRKDAQFIERQIRAMSPRPGAYTYMGDRMMKVLSADIYKKVEDAVPGKIKEVSSRGILVSTGTEDILITKIQVPGRQAVKVGEYIKGNKIEIGSILG